MRDKSIHDIRGIAHSFGIADVLAKTKEILLQEIEQKQRELVDPVVSAPPIPAYDARLMTKVPRRKSEREEILLALKDHIALGLHVDFIGEEEWQMSFGKRVDTGTIRMPIRTIIKCAEGMFK